MRRLVLSLLATLFVLGFAKSVPAYGATRTPQERVTICHRDRSILKPYVQETVSEDSIVRPDGTVVPNGHGTHTGPVFPMPAWGDIIPPFEYNNDSGGTSTYPGMNWTDNGQAIWFGGCDLDLIELPPEGGTTTTTSSSTTTTLPPTSSSSTTTTLPPTSSSSTSSSSTTTTVPSTSSSSTTTPLPPTSSSSTSSSSTTTTVPSTSSSSTTVPGATTSPTTSTTTTLPSTPPTTAPPSEQPPPLTDPPNGAEITTEVEAETITPHDEVTDLGKLDEPERVTLEEELDQTPSGAPQAGFGGASTGNGLSVGWAATGGTFLFFAGLAGVWAWRRRSAT